MHAGRQTRKQAGTQARRRAGLWLALIIGRQEQGGRGGRTFPPTRLASTPPNMNARRQRQAGRQPGRQEDIHTSKQANMQADRQAGMQAGR